MDRDEPNATHEDNPACTTATETYDKVNPPHYDGDSCMRLMAAVTARMTGKEAVCIATAIKYMYRAGRKPSETGADDCKKAEWYLGWLQRQWEHDGEADLMEHEGRAIKALKDIMAYAAPEAWVSKMWGLAS